MYDILLCPFLVGTHVVGPLQEWSPWDHPHSLLGLEKAQFALGMGLFGLAGPAGREGTWHSLFGVFRSIFVFKKRHFWTKNHDFLRHSWDFLRISWISLEIPWKF